MSINPFAIPISEIQRSVDQAVLGHRAGEWTAAELVRSEELLPEQWPESWIEPERKAYERFQTVGLPEPAIGNVEFESVLEQRRTQRDFDGSLVTQPVLSALLGACSFSGSGDGSFRRSVPSAGATYPVEIYLLALAVEGLQSASYHYSADGHALTKLFAVHDPDVSELGLTSTPGCGLFVVLTGVMYRAMRKYGPRGYRFVLLEAGAIAQTLDLAARSVGLSCAWLGGFDDARLAELIGVRPELESELPLVVLAVGAAK